MRRVLYRTSGIDEWVDVAAELASEHDWTPVYWLDPSDLEEDVHRTFPDAEFHRCGDARRFGLPTDEINRYQPLDAEVLARYQRYRPYVLHTLGRLDSGHTFSYDERVRHYHRQLRYWLHVFRTRDIDLVIYTNWPHQVSGLIIYAICKENDITFAYLPDPIVPGCFRVDGDLFGENERLEELYLGTESSLDPDAISETSRRYLEDLSGNEATSSSVYSRNSLKYVSKLTGIARYPRYLSKLLQSAWRETKVRGRTLEDSNITLARKILIEKKVDRHKRKIRKTYDDLSVTPDYSASYVYFPLHCEPEASINPFGGFFRNQLNAIDLVSKTVPDGWRVFVKEHPDQYIMNKLNEGRQRHDYGDIRRLENVEFIERSCSTFDLVDNAETTATITGTAAWESVVRGTPSIVFGHARFQLCEGIFHVTTAEQLESALEAIREMETVDQADVRRFVRALEVVGYRGYTTGRQRENFDVSRAENVANTAEALYQFVQNQ